MKTFSALLIFLCCHVSYVVSDCATPIVPASEMSPSVELPVVPEHHRSKRAAITKLRIHFDYLSSFEAITDSNYIKLNVINVVKARIEAIVKAKNPTSSNLLVDRQCVNGKYGKNVLGEIACAQGCNSQTLCKGVPIPDKYLKDCATITDNGTIYRNGISGSGISDTDLVVLVSSNPCEADEHPWGVSCFLEKSLDRPILGVLNICSGVIKAGTEIVKGVDMIFHEMVHILGFSVDKYAYYRYRNGSTRVPRDTFNFPTNGVKSLGVFNWNDNVAKEVIRTRYYKTGAYAKTMNAFTLPNVVKAAREHFNCPTLAEVDLEDASFSNSGLSHFDSYFLHGEIMTVSVDSFRNSLSDMTLALLYDTGWYDVDFTQAHFLDYGKNKGCLLPTLGCYKYMVTQKLLSQSFEPFCDKYLEPGKVLNCSKDFKYYELCFLKIHNSLDAKYQYFDNPQLGGMNEYNEFCPLHKSLTDPSFNCEDAMNAGKNSTYFTIPNYFGEDSRCMETNTQLTNSYQGAACMKYECNKSNKTYTIILDSIKYNCVNSSTYSLPKYSFSFKCQPYSNICEPIVLSKVAFQPYSDSGNIIAISQWTYCFIAISWLSWISLHTN